MKLHSRSVENKLPSEIFSSKIVFKILEELVVNGPQTRTSLSRKTGSQYTRLVRYLDRLIDIGVVREVKAGKMSIYMLNEENPKGRLIKSFIERWLSFNGEVSPRDG